MKKIFSIIIILSIACACLFGLIACNKVADNTQYYDKITSTLKLNKNYDGKSFLDDGVGLATVDSYTDGDTTRFKLVQGTIVSIRYYQIDTPESTGNVEKWGKAASKFVEDRLSQATEVVLEATEPKAVKDSYGTRYLGYVWYKTADHDFKNLNLEVVENGFSANKGDNTSSYPYNEYFKKANDFAQSIKLRIYSDLEDPMYSNDPIPMTIKEFIENNELFYIPETDVGAKVEFTAYITDLRVSPSDTYTFTALQYEPETGKTYSINVYAGYSSSSVSKLKIGHMYHIIGNIQKYNGSFQVSGLSYGAFIPVEGETTVTQRNYYMIFDSQKAFIMQLSDVLYTNVTVTEVSVNNGVITFKGTAKQRKADGVKDDEKTFTFTVKAPANYNNQIGVGSVLSLTGLQLVKDSGEITILDYSNIAIK